jgi:glutathione S-transferase
VKPYRKTEAQKVREAEEIKRRFEAYQAEPKRRRWAIGTVAAVAVVCVAAWLKRGR